MENTIKEYSEVLQNISNMSIEECENHLRSIVVGFNLKTEDDLRAFLNNVNEASNNYNITVDQIVQALSKLSMTSYNEKITIEKAMGYVVNVGTVTRETGNIIGNALKGIFSRVNKVDKATSILESVGVKSETVDGVIEQLSSKWNSIEPIKQQEIAEAVAGRYQQSRFSILLHGLSN